MRWKHGLFGTAKETQRWQSQPGWRYGIGHKWQGRLEQYERHRNGKASRDRQRDTKTTKPVGTDRGTLRLRYDTS